mmetsp:Transcript_19868/g.29762  ORF Transcript_19868/g.29762 Transcript_19868/m.29762 type:complete len:169 (-) Transcript_19868:314-820(-)
MGATVAVVAPPEIAVAAAVAVAVAAFGGLLAVEAVDVNIKFDTAMSCNTCISIALVVVLLLLLLHIVMTMITSIVYRLWLLLELVKCRVVSFAVYYFEIVVFLFEVYENERTNEQSRSISISVSVSVLIGPFWFSLLVLVLFGDRERYRYAHIDLKVYRIYLIQCNVI